LVLHGLLSDDEGTGLAIEFSDKYKIKTLFDNCDLRQAAAIELCIVTALEVMGTIDILVNNASIQYTENISAFPASK